MSLEVLDWAIILGVFGTLGLIAMLTKRYTHSVADFLAANRCGGRYMLTIAGGMSGLGAISVIAFFEQGYRAGFCAQWWVGISMFIGLFVSLSGWVAYRFRETRALTMAQFFEMRYSRKFRIFAGITAWISGLVNYGIFPVVTARVIIYTTGMPISVYVAGFEIPTHALVMPVMLGIAIYMTFSGGQITVMVTDFLQGIFTNVVLITLMLFVFLKYGWSNILEGLNSAPEGKSMINPFKQGELSEFNFFFFAIQAFIVLYGCMAWQGSQGYFSSAKSPHEARMAKVLGNLRGGVTNMMILILPIVVFAVLNNPKFISEAEPIRASISQIDDTQIQEQMRVTVSLQHILPSGLIGLFCALIIAAAISTDDTYLHSWGTIFVQDVIMPFRKKPLSQEQHLKYLKASIFFVAVFAYIFGLIFPLKDYIFMFWSITGAIFVGGAGAAIVGGLYWKRGTASGAWSGMITGSVLAVSGILLQSIIWPFILPSLKASYPDLLWLHQLPDKFPINGIWMSFIASLIALVVYVTVSLCSKNPHFNLDRMLHRGKYAIEGEHVYIESKKQNFLKMIGVGKEFTRGDRVICMLSIFWTIPFIAVIIIAPIIWWTIGISDKTWATHWLVRLWVVGIVAVSTTVWFIIGGFRNMIELFKTLKEAKRDLHDDGTIKQD